MNCVATIIADISVDVASSATLQNLADIQKRSDAFYRQFLGKLRSASSKTASMSGTCAKKIAVRPVNEKMRRTKLSLKAVEVLQRWYRAHLDRPYPSELEKEDLAAQARLTKKQVTNWFTNTRKRKGNKKGM